MSGCVCKYQVETGTLIISLMFLVSELSIISEDGQGVKEIHTHLTLLPFPEAFKGIRCGWGLKRDEEGRRGSDI